MQHPLFGIQDPTYYFHFLMAMREPEPLDDAFPKMNFGIIKQVPTNMVYGRDDVEILVLDYFLFKARLQPRLTKLMDTFNAAAYSIAKSTYRGRGNVIAIHPDAVTKEMTLARMFDQFPYTAFTSRYLPLDRAIVLYRGTIDYDCAAVYGESEGRCYFEWQPEGGITAPEDYARIVML